MSRRLLLAEEHDPNRSLGWFAVWWIETFVQHGRGDAAGMPIKYGDEYTGVIVNMYAVGRDGRRLYDSAFFSRPKGCDKSGLAAALCLVEAFAPVRFDRWAEGGETYEFLGRTYVYQRGEPIGKAIVKPVIKILSTEEEQTGNVYENILWNLRDGDEAPLRALAAYGVETYDTKVIIGTGGYIVPASSGADSKDGGLETFVVADESHLYNNSRLRKMYSTVTRNLVKRKKVAEPWILETTTMYAPGEDSIAERTYFLADQIEKGRARRNRLMFDHRWADIVDIRSEQELRKAFVEAYGDAMEWNDLDSLVNSVFDSRQTESETRRYFFNALVARTNSWFQLHEWEQIGVRHMREKAVRQKKARLRWKPPMPGDRITLGFDGSLNNDATVLIACRVDDGYVFPLGIWETPDGPEAKDYQIDRSAVDRAVREAFRVYEVLGFFADPPFWQDYIDNWERDFRDQLVVKVNDKHPIQWYTNRPGQQVEAVERFHTAVLDKKVMHGNHPTLTNHVLNAVRWYRDGGKSYYIGKEKAKSMNKMDAAVGAVLAYEAAARWSALDHTQADTMSIPERVR